MNDIYDSPHAGEIWDMDDIFDEYGNEYIRDGDWMFDEDYPRDDELDWEGYDDEQA